MLQWELVESAPFAENTYIVYRTVGGAAVVIDPGDDPEAVAERLAALRLAVVAILNTHGHLDHIFGNGALKECFPAAPLIIGAGDEPALTDAERNLGAQYGFEFSSPPADRTVNEGDVLELLDEPWRVLEIPGHSPGHVVFVLDRLGWVFGGDVLFAGGIGRTDFPDGDGPALLRGIREKLYALPPATIVFPGHGPTTTIGQERASNPFTRGA